MQTLSALGLSLLAATAMIGQPPAPSLPGQVDDAAVLTRGPIHEAYAKPVHERPQPTPIVSVQPPEAIEELPPDHKPAADNLEWIPGYWAWDDALEDFVWVSGLWRDPPPGRQWVPGYWSRAQQGWQWTPGIWAETEQEQFEYLPPPPPSIDSGPSAPPPKADSLYVPGSWVFREARYLWRPGLWYSPRPGWLWVPAHFAWAPAGYLFVEGYWDRALEDRGLLFAPVYFRQPFGPGQFFRPQYAVYPDFLRTAMFVRPGASSYFFGDYFDPAYNQLGYRSWLDPSLNRFSGDPLLDYYRWQNRGERDWLPRQRELYASRYQGTAPRPPQTLAQQKTMLQNVSKQKVTVKNVNHVTVVAPLTNMDQRRSAVKLQAVAPAQQRQVLEASQMLRKTGNNRTQAEARLLSQGPAASRPGDPARAARLQLPRSPSSARPPAGVKTPPSLPQPKHEVRPIPKYQPPPAEVRPAPKRKIQSGPDKHGVQQKPKQKPGPKAHPKKDKAEKHSVEPEAKVAASPAMAFEYRVTLPSSSTGSIRLHQPASSVTWTSTVIVSRAGEYSVPEVGVASR